MATVKETMERMVESFDTGDVSGVGSFVAHSYIDHQGLGGQQMNGPEGFRHVVEVARRSFRDLDVNIQDLIANGDRVAARLLWVGTRKADDVVVTRETIDIVKVQQGKAVEHWGQRLWVDPA